MIYKYERYKPTINNTENAEIKEVKKLQYIRDLDYLKDGNEELRELYYNSFLLHGYYNYKHLILTKEMVRGQEQYYIGAPGNFYTKEKQVAILFGFESFEGKVEPAQNGDFGYYMIPVEI